MNASEIGCELVRKLRQRTVNQIFSVDVMDTDVFLIGAKVKNVPDRNEPEFIARTNGDVLSSRVRTVGLRDIVELRSRQSTCLTQRLFETLFSDWLQEIAYGLCVECLHRILVVCRGEHDGGRGGKGREMTRCLDPAHARHANIQKHDRGLKFFHRAKCVDPGRALGDYEGARDFSNETIEPLSSVLLVIHDQH